MVTVPSADMRLAMARVVRSLLVLLAGLAGLAVALLPASADEPDARLWAEIIQPAAPPYHPQQMLLLRIKGIYRIPITLEKLVTPDITAARVVTIGKDRWFDTVDAGLASRAYEHTVAVFPQESGRFVIPAFEHQLTVATVGEDGQRMKRVIASPPITLTIDPAPLAADGWWLPAANLTVEDNWTVAPEDLPIGRSTRRTITIRAEGVSDDQLPPAPDLSRPGLIVFAGAPIRETVLGIRINPEDTGELRRQALRKPGRLKEVPGPEGPIATVTYSYDIRPAAAEGVVLPAIEIPWYDTLAGRMQVAVIPERTVKLESTEPTLADLEAKLGIRADGAAGDGGRAIVDAMLAGLAALATMFLVLAIGARGSRADPLVWLAAFRRGAHRRRATADLIAAARRGDGRAALKALGRLDGLGEVSVRDGARDGARARQTIEAAAFGRETPSPEALAAAARDLARATR